MLVPPKKIFWQEKDYKKYSRIRKQLVVEGDSVRTVDGSRQPGARMRSSDARFVRPLADNAGKNITQLKDRYKKDRYTILHAFPLHTGSIASCPLVNRRSTSRVHWAVAIELQSLSSLFGGLALKVLWLPRACVPRTLHHDGLDTFDDVY